MVSQLITVVGLTGSQGSSVADTFLKTPGWRVRGITRDPSKPSVQEWAQKGVEVIKADLKDAESLIRAFQGSDVIFAMTDFLAAQHDPEVQAKASGGIVPFLNLAKDLELQSGKNLVDAAAVTLARHGLKRFIFSTLSGAKYWSKGKYTNVLHFESKFEVVQYMNEAQPKLAAVASTVQLGYFYSNWKAAAVPSVQKESDGSYLIRAPISGDAIAPYTDPRRDTGLLVEALVTSPPGTNVLGYGTNASLNHWTEVFAKTHGVKARYEKVPRIEVEERFPGGWGDELVSMFEYTEEFGLDGGDPDIKSPSEIGVKLPLTTFKMFMETEDFSSVLA